MQPLLELFRLKFRKIYIPESSITVDESLLGQKA
jgi:hypothetical protein